MIKNSVNSVTYQVRSIGIVLTVITLLIASSSLALANSGPYEFGKIGDRVWEDINFNGIQDEGEPGVEGVTVNLYDCCTMILVATTTTDENGSYCFEDIPANYQSYYIEFVLPAGWKFTTADVGNYDVDSDADPVTGLTVCTNLANGEEDYTWDAGLVRVTNEIPEFPTIALPMAAIIGLAFIFRRRNE
jgi:hypothetical protein